MSGIFLKLVKNETDTDCMEQSPSWEANNNSASQEIPLLLWNPKVYYRIHKSPPLVLIPSQMNPVNIFPSYFPNIYFNIILQSIATSETETSTFNEWRYSSSNLGYYEEK